MVELSDAGREILCRRYLELDPNGEAEIFLSGGVDSATILFAALECGFKPRCLTFYVEGIASSDLAVSKSMCARFGLTHEAVEIPSDLETLIADCQEIIGELIDWSYFPSLSARVIQTVHPTLYLVPQMQASLGLFGEGGDPLAVTARDGEILCRRGGEEMAWGLRAYRELTPDNWLATCNRYARARGRSVKAFYHSPSIYRWARSMSRERFNTPKQKWGLVSCFLDYWKHGKWYRRNSPYQINSGLRELHDKLLQSRYNTGGYVKPIGCYRVMAGELGVHLGTRFQQRFMTHPLPIVIVQHPMTLS